MIYHSIQHARHCENSTHYCTDASQKVSEGSTVLCQLDHHWTQIVHEEYTCVFMYMYAVACTSCVNVCAHMPNCYCTYLGVLFHHELL